MSITDASKAQSSSHVHPSNACVKTMSGTNHLVRPKRFQVRVGLAECTVTCDSPTEAVRMARAELRRKMPQMWEAIYGIADKEFRVDQIG